MSLALTVLGVPPTKLPLGVTTLVSYILPPVICYFMVAVLAVTPQTHAIRIALWPVVVLLAFRAVVSVDMWLGEPKHQSLNTDLLLIMLNFVVRALDWTLDKKPLVRHLRPRNSSPSIIMDAIDLTLNIRGHGWNLSYGVPIPHETRSTNRKSFLTYTFLSAIVHTLVMGIFLRAILIFGPGAIPKGSTIFDDALPFQLRYIRSSIISICAALMVYAIMQTGYDVVTITGVFLFGQDPTQWPPAFDAPWRATSLTEFWGRRWHQWTRRFFIIGGYPLSIAFGRSGMVVGAFLASAVLHHVLLLAINPQLEAQWMFIGFGMMAPGVLAERAFLRLTGKRVGGVAGWVWTMTWLLLWGHLIVEGFARSGIFFDYGSPIDGVSPVRALVDCLVSDFETWVHTI
ncbi:hypothetical protein JVU11DRAFT_1010 [Chiua virens]|nr:hypothetical protein JVU11DRAFT_1010 [Chiua virens]